MKRISLVRKRADLTREEFFARWSGEHSDWARQLPGLHSLVIDLPFEHEPGVQLPYDGIAIATFDSVEAAKAAFATEPIRTKLLETRGDFAADVDIVFAEEHVMVEAEGSRA